MNKKGFTLTELLAVVTILGIVSLIGAVLVFAIKHKFDNNYYKMLTNNVSAAAKDYGSDHRGDMNSEGVKIDISTIVKNGYISKILDKDSNECTGYVLIKKKRLSYDTKVCLICDDYKSKGCEE